MNIHLKKLVEIYRFYGFSVACLASMGFSIESTEYFTGEPLNAIMICPSLPSDFSAFVSQIVGLLWKLSERVNISSPNLVIWTGEMLCTAVLGRAGKRRKGIEGIVQFWQTI